MKWLFSILIVIGFIGCTNQLQFLSEPTTHYFRDSLTNEIYDSSKKYFSNLPYDSIHYGVVDKQTRLRVYWNNGTKSYEVIKDRLSLNNHRTITSYDSLHKRKEHKGYRFNNNIDGFYIIKHKYYSKGHLDSIQYFNKDGSLSKIRYRN